MPSLSTIEESIEGLYSTFAVYPLPGYTDPCTHCHSQDDEAKLHSASLRNLGVEELRDYAWDAMLVWGDDKIFRHFLPRLFELYITTEDAASAFVDPEILFAKLAYAGWRQWPQVEQVAVERFLYAFWHHVLSQMPGPFPTFTDVESSLCAMARAEDTLAGYFAVWLDEESLTASLALSSFILTSAVTLENDSGRNAFWDRRDVQYAQVKTWIKTTPVTDTLESSIRNEAWAEYRSEFEAAASMLAHN